MIKPKIVIREAEVSDAKALLSTFKSILNTSRWILSEPDEVADSIKEEKVYIKRHADRDNAVILLAELDGLIVGILNAWGDARRRRKHVVGIGISVLKDYRGQGVGLALLKELFYWARLKKIKKISLSVIENNVQAINLYKKFGFVIEGKLKKEMKINKRYHDVVLMAKFV